MANLLKLKQVLIKNKPDYPINYAIPGIFNLFSHQSITKLKNGEELINPYDFLIDLIDTFFLKDKYPSEAKSLSLLKKKKPKTGGGDWIRKSVVYSMMIRTSSAWDHDRNGFLDKHNIYNLKETGTFIKTLMLLPLLKEMGVNALYLLPISKYSLKNKKGDLGSPYSVSNFFELDPNLSDPMVENDLSLDDQFQVLVEACHSLDMRVLIDIIPRTNATESELIIDHPDWFYWINTRDLTKYKTPYVSKITDKTVAPTMDLMETVYSDQNILDHLSLFQFDPKTTNPAKWEFVVEEYKKGDKNILNLVDKYYGLTTAPAFSDHINDVQPPWSDVTFFRMYLDHPLKTSPFLKNKNIPPYILFDTIKANLYPGKKPNLELWNVLANIIPHFQKKYGIDGARIDMGHALPDELVHLIIKNARKIDPDFCFIAEELNPENDQKAKDLGYNMIIGNGFSLQWDLENLNMHRFMYEQAKLKLPTFACGETHDTPRLAARDGGATLAKFLTVMNMFVPNTVPFINSGQEVYEKQPMNTGIGPRENELYMLDESDPYYMKLALFDRYAFHYLNHMSFDIKDNLKKIHPIRTKYLNAITNLDCYQQISFLEGHNLIGFAYETKTEILFVVGNPYYSFAQHGKLDLTDFRCDHELENEGFLLYGMHEKGPRPVTEFDSYGNPYFLFGSGEVKIFIIKKKTKDA